ncbi:MAG: hypothetical protein HN952_00395 [Candidatus Cloacimonetes bacterium]|nr:hypothetical protein [Candidatus Cloacimonadota bacterium]MBT6993393.1 hypothetical protein [Candidatus Cloacimonadota bacterium]MBT7470215.1 hypothetical protein [Candidatus Cloacimonadota bacterium]
MFKKIINIISWAVLLLAFAALGLSSDAPIFGFFFYLVFFAIVFGLIFLYLKKHNRRTSIKAETKLLINKIVGASLMAIAILSPTIALRRIGLPFLPNLIIIIITAILVVFGIYAVMMINAEKNKRILGYLLLIVLATIPSIFATTYLTQYFPNTYNALGVAYWAIVSVSIFSWWGLTVFFKKA